MIEVMFQYFSLVKSNITSKQVLGRLINMGAYILGVTGKLEKEMFYVP